MIVHEFREIICHNYGIFYYISRTLKQLFCLSKVHEELFYFNVFEYLPCFLDIENIVSIIIIIFMR